MERGREGEGGSESMVKKALCTQGGRQESEYICMFVCILVCVCVCVCVYTHAHTYIRKEGDERESKARERVKTALIACCAQRQH